MREHINEAVAVLILTPFMALVLVGLLFEF